MLAPEVIYNAQAARLERFAELLDSYDLLCLQELTVFWGLDGYVRHLRSLAFAKGLRHQASSGRWPCWPATFAAAGLELLSRHRVVRSSGFAFRRQAWFEWSAIARGGLMAELDVAGRRVAVLNLHTTAGLEVLEVGLGLTSSSNANPVGLEQLLEALEHAVLGCCCPGFDRCWLFSAAFEPI